MRQGGSLTSLLTAIRDRGTSKAWWEKEEVRGALGLWRIDLERDDTMTLFARGFDIMRHGEGREGGGVVGVCSDELQTGKRGCSDERSIGNPQ